MEAYFASFPIWANFLFFAAGLLIITKGADWFTDGAVGVAEITGVPKVIVGATLVSLATTAPEFSVSVIAAWLEHPATSVGNAVGSTICNIGLILAVAFLLEPVSLAREDVLPKGLFMLMLGVLLLTLGWDGKVARVEGVVLFIFVPVYLWFTMKRATWTDFDFGSAMTDRETQHVGLRFIAGSIAVVFGSVLLVQNAVHLARAMGVPELVIGLTLVAIGTSLPELITAVSASLSGHGDMAVGNVLGANVLNISWVLGGASLIAPLGIERQSFVLDFPFMLLLMLMFLLLAFWKRGMGRRAGFMFLAGYVCYLSLMFAYFV
ncbi:MAG: calcium/sodium antiporter [Nitrospinae bacterium]|nr:calcium/sodium antiporter [Nitrospinota bacterium]